jgi:hypothetical protein
VSALDLEAVLGLVLNVALVACLVNYHVAKERRDLLPVEEPYVIPFEARLSSPSEGDCLSRSPATEVATEVAPRPLRLWQPAAESAGVD